MHAQRMRVVVCQTALTCHRACYDISRARVACVWGAAHTGGQLRQSSLEGLKKGGRWVCHRQVSIPSGQVVVTSLSVGGTD